MQLLVYIFLIKMLLKLQRFLPSKRGETEITDMMNHYKKKIKS